MTTLSKGLSDVFKDCKNWMARNPSKVKTWETRIFLILQVLLGRFNNTNLKAEWFRSAHRIVSLFNSLIIFHSNNKKPFDNAEKLNICVSVLERCEIAIEKSSEQLWGKEGKLNVIQYLQIIKFLAKITLILYFKQKIIHFYAELENHKTVPSNVHSHDYVEFQSGSNNILRLKRSGRIMRTVASAPPLRNRLWKPPVMRTEDSVTMKSREDEEQIVRAMGELLYVIKPIINLALIRKLGPRSWKQWTCSLFMDLLSLHLLQFPTRRRNMKTQLTPVQMSILAQRRINLSYYLIRSPFFQSKIANPLYLILYMIPIIGPFVSDELRFYLTSYFFLWSK